MVTAATVRNGSALPVINALSSRNAISETPRPAGYRAAISFSGTSRRCPTVGFQTIAAMRCEHRDAIDPLIEVYPINIASLKRTHKADLNLRREILARFCNCWTGLYDLVTEPSFDTRHG